MEEIYDQAALMGLVVGTHLKTHKDNKPDPECVFCKNFVITEEPRTYPLESYSFIIMDVSKD